MLLHLCVAAPANLSRSAIAKQFVHAKCQRGDISRVKCAGWHLNTDITARGCGESVSIKRLHENAMIHYRSLFEELVQVPVIVERKEVA
jgi:hypothetical protein